MPFSALKFPILCSLFSLLLFSCGEGAGPAAPQPQPAPMPPAPAPPPPAPADGAPLLGAGPHMGFIVGFDALDAGPPDRAARADALTNEAINAGMSIGRIQLDWPELETAPRTYDEGALADALAVIDSRLNIFVTLSTLDSDGLTLPDDLLNGVGELRAGLSLDSDEVIGRFRDFLDWLVPQLEDSNVWGLALGNEIDAPAGDGLVSEDAAIAFYETGLAYANTLAPDIAMTVTMTGLAFETAPTLNAAIVAASDIFSLNYYCLNGELLVTGQTQWEQDVAAIKAAADGKDIFMQELGCPVGYGDDGAGAPARQANGLGGSPDIQVQFFDYMMEEFAQDPQLRAATVFQLFDWSPQLAQSFSQALLDEGAPVAADRLEEWLATSGLCRWADATCRPAWDTWKDGLSRLQSQRSQSAWRRFSSTMQQLGNCSNMLTPCLTLPQNGYSKR